MSAFGNNAKDEVYYAIKELFANGYKISDLLEIWLGEYPQYTV